MNDPALKVLLVEDDLLLRDAFRMLLEDSGYEVIEAGNAAEALDRAAETLPGIILLDMGLPDRPGLEVVRDLRADPRLSGRPIIALTGQVGDAERQQCLEAGCSRYLTKPVAPQRLLEEITLVASGP